MMLIGVISVILISQTVNNVLAKGLVIWILAIEGRGIIV